MTSIFDGESDVLVLHEFDSGDDGFGVGDADCILSQISKRAGAKAIDASVWRERAARVVLPVGLHDIDRVINAIQGPVSARSLKSRG